MSAVRSGIAATCGLFAALLFWQGAVHAQSAPHDLKYIADKPLMAIWSHPNQHLANPVLAELVNLVQKSAPPGATVMMPEALLKLDLMRMSLSMGRTPWSDKPAPRGVSLYQFTDPAAATQLFNNMSKGLEAKTIPEWKVPIYSYKPYVVPGEPEKDAKLAMGVTQLNPNTVVQAESIEKLLEVMQPTTAAAPPAWSNDLANFAKTQTTLFIDLVQFREEMKEAGPRPGQAGIEGMIFNSVKQLWEQADYAFVSVDTTNGIQLSAQATSPNAESALRFRARSKGFTASPKDFSPRRRKQPCNSIRCNLAWVKWPTPNWKT